MKLFRRWTRDEGGQAAVEFGRAWNEHQVITDAAREAARLAALGNRPQTTATEIENVAKNAMARAGIDVARVDSITLYKWDGDRDELLRVGIYLRYRFTFFGPLVQWATGDHIIVLKTAVAMRNE